MTQFINGMPIHIDDFIGVKYELQQLKFPRSKKRRVRKKWSRQSKNFAVQKCQEPACYRFGQMLVMNSTMLVKLKQKLAESPAPPEPRT